MNYTCTVGHGNVAVTGNKVTLFILLFANRLYKVEQRLIFFIFEVCTDIFLYYFVSGGLLGG